MTKKDYIKIASVLKNCKPSESIYPPDEFSYRDTQWRLDVYNITQVLEDDNPMRFDVSRFYLACGYLD